MSKILAKEIISPKKAIVYMSLGNVMLVDSEQDDGSQAYEVGVLLCNTAVGCETLAKALENLAKSIRQIKNRRNDA